MTDTERNEPARPFKRAVDELRGEALADEIRRLYLGARRGEYDPDPDLRDIADLIAKWDVRGPEEFTFEAKRRSDRPADMSGLERYMTSGTLLHLWGLLGAARTGNEKALDLCVAELDRLAPGRRPGASHMQALRYLVNAYPDAAYEHVSGALQDQDVFSAERDAAREVHAGYTLERAKAWAWKDKAKAYRIVVPIFDYASRTDWPDLLKACEAEEKKIGRELLQEVRARINIAWKRSGILLRLKDVLDVGVDPSSVWKQFAAFECLEEAAKDSRYSPDVDHDALLRALLALDRTNPWVAGLAFQNPRNVLWFLLSLTGPSEDIRAQVLKTLTSSDFASRVFWKSRMCALGYLVRNFPQDAYEYVSGTPEDYDGSPMIVMRADAWAWKDKARAREILEEHRRRYMTEREPEEARREREQVAAAIKRHRFERWKAGQAEHPHGGEIVAS